MLIEFTVENFRSIRERQSLSMRASRKVGKNDLREHLAELPEKRLDDEIIKTAVLFGSNAAGKSNLLRAFRALECFVEDSSGYKLDQPIPMYDPYRLDRESRSQPTGFTAEFIAKDDIHYVYEVRFTAQTILSEDLHFYPKNRKVSRRSMLFSRADNGAIAFGESYTGKKDFSLLGNQLLLSQAGLHSLPSLVEPYRFFATFLCHAAADTENFGRRMLDIGKRLLSSKADDSEAFQRSVLSILKAGDIGISGIFTETMDESSVRLPDGISLDLRKQLLDQFRVRLKTIHPVYHNGAVQGEEIFDLKEESTGTRQLLAMAIFVLDAISDGSIIVVDELDKNLHPLLTRLILGLFHNPEVNKKNAQLIFSTHDISLMDRDLFRLDQILIADKGPEGRTTVSRLSDFNGISKTRNIREWYSNGLFKGIPAINDALVEV